MTITGREVRDHYREGDVWPLQGGRYVTITGREVCGHYRYTFLCVFFLLFCFSECFVQEVSKHTKVTVL